MLNNIWKDLLVMRFQPVTPWVGFARQSSASQTSLGLAEVCINWDVNVSFLIWAYCLRAGQMITPPAVRKYSREQFYSLSISLFFWTIFPKIINSQYLKYSLIHLCWERITFTCRTLQGSSHSQILIVWASDFCTEMNMSLFLLCMVVWKTTIAFS